MVEKDFTVEKQSTFTLLNFLQKEDAHILAIFARPGKPLAFGLIGCVPVFGLPGNPVSSMVTFEEFVRPAILKMSGARGPERYPWCAILKEDICKRKGIREYIRVAIEERNGNYYARRAGPQGSGMLKSMVLADGLLAVPEDKEVLKKGETVYISPLR